MRRRLIQLGLFVLAGAIVNVAVAWGCLRIPMAKQKRVLQPSEIRHLMALQTTSNWNDHDYVSALEKRQFGATWIEMHDGGPFLVLRGAGWPFVSLRGEQALDPPYPKAWIVSTGRHSPSIVIPDSAMSDFTPDRTERPGFAINTMFYAGILWMVFAAPLALRRRRRIRRGLCPACAYPVGKSDVCTECGKPHTVKPKEMMA